MAREDGYFSSARQPENPGRTPTKWLRDRMDKAVRDGDITAAEKIADHLIEVASSWEIRIAGRGADSEPIEVADGKSSVMAAQVLFAYYMGLPKKGARVQIPTSLDPSMSTFDMVLETYRARLLAGEMTEDELLAVTKIFADAEKSEAEMIARVLGDKSAKNRVIKERVERLLARMEEREARFAEQVEKQTPALPPVPEAGQ